VASGPCAGSQLRATRAGRGRERFSTYNGEEPQAGSPLLEADGAALRTWGWIAYRFGIDLWFVWQGGYYRDVENGGSRRSPANDPRSYDRRISGRAA
jgi:hypothetical protein